MAADCLSLQSNQVKTNLRLKLKTFYFLQAIKLSTDGATPKI